MKNYFFPLFLLIFGLCCIFPFYAESNDKTAENDAENSITEAVKIHAGYLKSPSSIPFTYMMEQVKKSQKNDDDIQFYFEKFTDAQTMVSALMEKKLNIVLLPVNLAAKIYNTCGKSIVCIAVTENTSLKLISKDKSIREISDLSGRTVYIPGSGAAPEYLVRWILAQNNISDVTLDYSLSAAEIVSAVLSDRINYGILPQPFAQLALEKSESVFYALDLQKEYERITEKGRVIPLMTVAADKEFAEENPEAVKLFLENLESSENRAVKNPSSAGKYCEKYDLGLSAALASAAIPQSNFVFAEANQDREKIEEILRIFLEYKPDSIGGKLPDLKFCGSF